MVIQFLCTIILTALPYFTDYQSTYPPHFGIKICAIANFIFSSRLKILIWHLVRMQLQGNIFKKRSKTIGHAKLTSSRFTNQQLCTVWSLVIYLQCKCKEIFWKNQNNWSCKAYQLQINQSAAVYCLKLGYLPSVQVQGNILKKNKTIGHAKLTSSRLTNQQLCTVWSLVIYLQCTPPCLRNPHFQQFRYLLLHLGVVWSSHHI